MTGVLSLRHKSYFTVKLKNFFPLAVKVHIGYKAFTIEKILTTCHRNLFDRPGLAFHPLEAQLWHDNRAQGWCRSRWKQVRSDQIKY